MRKWKTRAAPDDPNVWSDVSGMWPTTQGTYEVADIYGSPTTLTATGETGGPPGSGSGLSAWGFNVLSGQRFYIVGTKIWELSGGTLTDRTGGITVAGGHMCQYGNVSVLARGTSNSLAVSTGGNFSALAGSPSANIVVTQSNALVAFNTSVSSDGWAASDVGDYTNWTTGEASSGRILDHNGPITAAVPFGNDIIVFKADAIFRMTYVGGQVKWQVQKVSEGVGCYDTGDGFSGFSGAEACGDCIIFLGVLGVSNQAKVYRFDGSAVPQLINWDTDIPGNTPMPCYDPANRRVFFMYYNGASVIPIYYALDSDSWGRGADLFSTVGQVRPLFMRGDHSAVVQVIVPTGRRSTARPIYYAATDSFKQLLPVASGGSTSSSAYVQTAKYGQPNRKTLFSRVTPLLRVRTNNSGGSPACSLTTDFFLERHDTSTSSTASVTESTTRKRFDFLKTECYGRFKITFTDMAAEIDDALVATKDAGAE